MPEVESKVIQFKQTIVTKLFADLLKDVPATDSLDGGKSYKLINGVFIREGMEIPHEILTKTFMYCLLDTYVATEHILNIVPGVKIGGGTMPYYEEFIDPVTLETCKKLRMLFVIPPAEGWPAESSKAKEAAE